MKSTINEEESFALKSRNLSPRVKLVNNNFESYRQNYHTIINNSQRTHRISKDIEINVVGAGHLIGIEDTILATSIHQSKCYRYTAVWKSATWKVLYFDKQKWFDKLKFLGCYDKIVDIAKKKDFRFKETKERSSLIFKDAFAE